MRLAIAGSGVPAHTVAGGTSVAATSFGVPADAIPVPGYYGEIPEDELTCSMMKLDGSGPCTAPRIRGDEVCIGHARSREKTKKGS